MAFSYSHLGVLFITSLCIHLSRVFELPFLYSEDYPHVYPHCLRSGDELVYRSVDEWYINMDWREEIKKITGDINWIPPWGHERENEWLDNMVPKNH